MPRNACKSILSGGAGAAAASAARTAHSQGGNPLGTVRGRRPAVGPVPHPGSTPGPCHGWWRLEDLGTRRPPSGDLTGARARAFKAGPHGNPREGKGSRPSRSRVPPAGRPRAASSPPSRRRPAMLHRGRRPDRTAGYANAAAAARRYRMRSTTTSDSRNMPMPPPIMATHANIFSHRFTPRRGTGGVMNLSLSASCRAPGGTWPATRSGRSGFRAA